MFNPLKAYFESNQNCPRSIKRAFEDESFMFWLKFIEAQLVTSNEYVLKTESSIAAAFEVASDMACLRDKIQRRKDDNFLPFESRFEFDKLLVSKQVEIKEDVKLFYSSLSGYLDKWLKSLDGTEVFPWMKLVNYIDFEKDVVPAANYFKEHHPNSDLSMDALYDEFALLQLYVTENLSRWSSSQTSTDHRWLELLKSFKDQYRPIPNTSTLAQYALAVPGTSTEVERLFSIIKDVWGAEKGRLDHKTLEAHLDIKYNSNKTCQEFFAECKNNRKLLAQVQTSEKYTNISEPLPQASRESQ